MAQTGPWDWLPKGMFGRDFGSLANTPPCVRAGVLETIRDNQHLAFEYSENVFGTDRHGNQLSVFEYYLQHTPNAELEASFLLILRMWKDQGVRPKRRIASSDAGGTSPLPPAGVFNPQQQSRVGGIQQQPGFDDWQTLEDGFNSLHRGLQHGGLQWPDDHVLANSSMCSKRPVVEERSADSTSIVAGSEDAAIKTWERLTRRQYPRFERNTADDHHVPATVQLSETQIQQKRTSIRTVEHREYVEEHVEEHLEDPEEEHVEECEEVCERSFPPDQSLRDAREAISALYAKGEQSEEANHREAFTEAAHLKFMATLARPCFSALPIPDQKWTMKVYRGFTKEKNWPEEARRSIADDLKRLQPPDRAQFQWSDVDMDESDVVDDVDLPQAAEKAQGLLEKMLMIGDAGEPSSNTVLILKDALELRIPIQRRLVILTMAQVVFPKITIRTGSVTLDTFLAAHRSELEKWKSTG
ncbi:hypothetical protein KC318_g211 [Hortaea werneckii]|nr:hypothetical protein KC334_g101 [Hortaea werneckii]KAI7028001.1 hypothetical protein KC355_g131 [Hortaea werneckii]KAI7676527.1 hypothetical protein KC318_g211 [Hortaea werneckii]